MGGEKEVPEQIPDDDVQEGNLDPCPRQGGSDPPFHRFHRRGGRRGRRSPRKSRPDRTFDRQRWIECHRPRQCQEVRSTGRQQWCFQINLHLPTTCSCYSSAFWSQVGMFWLQIIKLANGDIPVFFFQSFSLKMYFVKFTYLLAHISSSVWSLIWNISINNQQPEHLGRQSEELEQREDLGHETIEFNDRVSRKWRKRCKEARQRRGQKEERHERRGRHERPCKWISYGKQFERRRRRESTPRQLSRRPAEPVEWVFCYDVIDTLFTCF